jgi:hypothetical protein
MKVSSLARCKVLIISPWEYTQSPYDINIILHTDRSWAMVGKKYSFIMVLHNFSEASENRLGLPLAPKASALFHSDAIAQFFSHP